MTPPLLTALIVSYRTPRLLDQLLTVLESEKDVGNIIVVENDSRDETVPMLRAKHPEVHLIEPGSNLGFARAVNLGIAEVSKQHVLLINPDCIPTPGAISTLLRFLVDNPSCGVVAPLTRHPTRQMGILAAGRQPTLTALMKHYFGVSSLFPGRRWALGWHLRAAHASRSAQEVEWVSGGCMLIRSEVLDELGGLSTDWFMYAEDMEFCLRARRKGWTIWHEPRAQVSHWIGASSAGSVNSRWVSVLIDYFERYLAPGRRGRRAYQATLFLGLASRALKNCAHGLHPGTDASADRYEALKNWTWARAALRPERDGLSDAPRHGGGLKPAGQEIRHP